jgi:uncharacterized protein YecE (DUF72 family)
MTAPDQGNLFRSPSRHTSLRVGPAGWNYKDWDGIVYPAPQPRAFDPLAYLADYFDTIEINSSFYAPPNPKAAAAWTRRVHSNPNFRFTAKAWQRLSHRREDATAASIQADCDQVRRSMAPLADSGLLGALLLQFPWSFRKTPENLDYLGKVLHALREFPVAVEVRHGSWKHELFFTILSENHAAFCNVDQPVIGDSLRPTDLATSRIGYFRLHGRNYTDWFREDAGRDARYNYIYSKEEVRDLSRQIRNIKQSTEETYAITNNHFRGQAVVNALEIMEELGISPRDVPPALAAAYPGRMHQSPR